jgi:hypothetical protein
MFDEDNENHSDPASGDLLETKGEMTQMSGKERNIMRRVYDALNVQYAAGVLIKDGKLIKPNFNCREF